MRRFPSLLALTAALALGPARPAAAQDAKVLKIATLAPEGSAWMKLFREWSGKIETRSGGKLKIKFYAGGVAGDERDAIRKMHAGQLSGGAITAVGLGIIQPEVRVLEVPFLIRSYDELDYVRNSLDGELKKKMEEKKFILLGWGDVGPVHLFSNIPLKTKDDLTKTKIWAWTDDPIVKGLFEGVGLHGVPLGVPDVLPALQTGMIDTCYGSPLSTVALRWHEKIKYVTSMVLSQSIGATVIYKKAWDELGPELQKIILEEAKPLEQNLLKFVREENTKSLKVMEARGIQVVQTPPEVENQFRVQAEAVGKSLEGKVYSAELHARVIKLVTDFRATHKK